jgi:hypothetical protein
MDLLKNHVPHVTQNFENWCIRNDYWMMLIGYLPSSLGPRREITPDDLKPYGEWVSCATPPAESGWYLLEGKYEDLDEKWDKAILPAWYHADEKEWEPSDGWFSEPRQWMEVPYLPELWQEATEHQSRELAQLVDNYQKRNDPQVPAQEAR